MMYIHGNQVNLILLFIPLFFLVACHTRETSQAINQANAPVCSEENKICPDGTVVGRSADNCKFSECPVLPSEKIIDPGQIVVAKEIPSAHLAYTFRAQIPSHWQVEAVPEIEALNFFDPGAAGENNLEKSQIFVRYFRASSFLTLSTVIIHSKTKTEISTFWVKTLYSVC